MSGLKVIVAGAGIGGLTAALALSRAGNEITVIERADEIKEVGAGLQISPNASHILIDLGLREALSDVALEPKRLRILSTRYSGELNHIPFARLAEPRYGAPYWVIHRADLHGVLLAAVRNDPRIDLCLGEAVDQISQTESGVTITTTASSGATTHDGDMLLGADGVWSTVRDRALGLPGADYSGRTAWRATMPIDAVAPEHRESSAVWFGKDAHLVHYPVHAGKSFNIVAVIAEPWCEIGWSAPASREVLLERFDDWPRAARDLLGLPDTWLKWALCGMPTGHPWQSGRVALLGDAAHAMLPFAAQGAAMAIEDAAVLASVLTNAPDIPSALTRYEAERRPRVERVMQTARDNDRIYHYSGIAAAVRDQGIRLLSPERLIARYDWIYGWKPPAAFSPSHLA